MENLRQSCTFCAFWGGVKSYSRTAQVFLFEKFLKIYVKSVRFVLFGEGRKATLAPVFLLGSPPQPPHRDIDASDAKFRIGRHRHTSQGAGGCSPPDSGKTIIFRAKARFFAQNSGAKNEKKTFFLYFLNEKTEFIVLSEIKVPEIRDFY